MTGLVLCGGDSTRLGYPKMLIERDGLPLYKWWLNALNQVCNDAFISCNPGQAAWIGNFPNLIPDFEPSKGPLMGIYTAFSQKKPEALMVVACELLYVGINELNELARARNKTYKATAFKDQGTGLAYPLFTIYEASMIQEIEWELKHGNKSPSRLLANGMVNFLNTPVNFRGINTREDLYSFLT
jgi:molybdopterin-guanine dinucleotide biosynthesis protein A